MTTATHGLTRLEYLLIYERAFTRSSHFRGAKLLAPALAPKVLLVRRSFGRAGKPVLYPSDVFGVFRV